MSEKGNRTQNLIKAILSYEEAIETYRQCKMNYACAERYIYLGDAYWSLSEIENIENNLKEALKAYDEALQIYPKNSYDYRRVEWRREQVSEKLKK